VFVFFCSTDKRTLACDPLITIFSLKPETLILIIAITGLAASVFCTRFWCRYLCPVGAFLSLLNAVAIAKRFLPAKKYNNCELGVTDHKQLDCIYCDKCRYEQALPESEKVTSKTTFRKNTIKNLVTASVLVIGVILSVSSIQRFLKVLPQGGYSAPQSAVSTAGQPRDVDLEHIKELIRQNRLSDKEAEYYKKIDKETPRLPSR